MRRKGRSDYQQYPARLKSTVPNLNDVKKHEVIKSDIDMNSIYLIPRLVNHEIRDKSYDKKSTVPVNYDKIGNTHNVPNVSETPNNSMGKKSDTNHRIIMLGDSHLEGVATNVKSLSKDNSKVCGLVKP
jgi:hypothetical protein